MTNFNKALGEGFGRGELGAALNYDSKDQFGGQKIGGLYIDGVVLPGGSVQGTYSASATQNYLLGARRVTQDGRVFKYAYATNEISSTHFGLKFWNKLSDGVTYTAVKQNQVVGDRTVWIDAGGDGAVTEDELKGGYLVVHTHSDNYAQNRLITGNTLADSDGYTIVTVDGGWTIALTTSHAVEIIKNPYSSVQLRQDNQNPPTDAYSSIAGIPMCKTTAANYYLWLQTWGPIWINPQGGSLQDSDLVHNERQLVFDYVGSVCVVGDAGNTTVSLQHAGFIIDRTASGASGPPFVMLQITPW